MSVDIIIPVYNTDKYLRRCLDSVLNQTFGDWRAVIVNDGSIDHSGEIAEEYACLDSRFHVIHKKNQGQYLARLDGIEATDGDIVMFLDSDDFWRTDCVSKVVNAFEENRADIVLFQANVMDEHGKTRFCVGGGFGGSKALDKQEVRRMLLTSHDLNSMCLKAFRRELLDVDTFRMPLDERVRMGEDKLMLLPIVSGAEKIYYLDEVLYNYAYTPDSSSHSYDVDKISAMIAQEMFLRTRSYIKLWDMDTQAINRAFGAYYLRHLMSCYYKIRRFCKDKQGKAQFKAYPWSERLGRDSIKYLFGKDLTIREKIKLLSMMICVRS